MSSRVKAFLRTFMIIIFGHTLICDVGAFVIGRYWVGLDTKLAIPLVIFAALLVTTLLERPWRCFDEEKGG